MAARGGVVNEIICGDALTVMRAMPAEIADCIVTSPPYWRMRDYGHPKQIGTEATMEEYIGNICEIFREAKRVLKSDGTLWLNLGDGYVGKGGHSHPNGFERIHRNRQIPRGCSRWGGGNATVPGLAYKCLIGMPWRIALKMIDTGWILRRDIIWHKTNPLPESVTDRPVTAHEYLFMFSKAPRYYYDADAVRSPYSAASQERLRYPIVNTCDTYGRHKPEYKKTGISLRTIPLNPLGKLLGSVWKIPTRPFKGPHFSTYPEELIRPCILAGSPEGGIVLDPFMGSGTTAVCALKHGRNYIGIELVPKNIEISQRRIDAVKKNIQPKLQIIWK